MATLPKFPYAKARPAKVDRDELLEIVDAIAKRGGALLDDVAEALRELSALLQKPIERVARQLLAARPRRRTSATRARRATR